MIRHELSSNEWQLSPWLALAALLVIAITFRPFLPANTDVGWLLTVAERVLDGQRLYIDVIETNPPMAVLVYMPAVLVARSFGLSAEMATDALVFAAAFASLAISARILKDSAALNKRAGWSFGLLAFAMLTIAPAETFAQREHIAVVELLPLLALYAVRTTGEKPPLWSIVVAGIGAGLALSFKPYFALGIFCGSAALAFHARSWRLLLVLENWIAGALVVIYALCVVWLYPAYISDILPLIREVYVLLGFSFSGMVGMPAIPIWAAASFAALVLRRSERIDGILLLLLATSFGFMLAFFVQRKGWPYQSYPMIAFAMLGLSYAVSRCTPRNLALNIFGTATLAVTFVASILWFNWGFDKVFDQRPLWSSVARFGPHPKILAITAEPALGHPMVRALQGTWVSRQQGLWVAGYLGSLHKRGMLGPQQEAIVERHAARERAMLIADIKKTEPTVVLVDNYSGRWSTWLADHPDVADLLKDYRPVATINDIELRARPLEIRLH